jgi:hypothetical protein
MSKLLHIKFLNILLQKLIKIFVFSKKKRLEYRNKLKDILGSALANKIREQYQNYYIFIPFMPLGDFAIGAALINQFKKEHGGKVLFLVSDKKHYKLTKLFPSIKEIIYDFNDEKLFNHLIEKI